MTSREELLKHFKFFKEQEVEVSKKILELNFEIEQIELTMKTKTQVGTYRDLRKIDLTLQKELLEIQKNLDVLRYEWDVSIY